MKPWLEICEDWRSSVATAHCHTLVWERANSEDAEDDLMYGLCSVPFPRTGITRVLVIHPLSAATMDLHSLPQLRDLGNHFQAGPSLRVCQRDINTEKICYVM